MTKKNKEKSESLLCVRPHGSPYSFKTRRTLCFAERIGNHDYVLRLVSMLLQDDAEYSVTARNVAGAATSHTQLLVEPAPTGAPSAFFIFLVMFEFICVPFSVQIIGVLSPDDLSATSGDASMASSMTLSCDTAVYPDEDALLQIAERVHHAHTNMMQTTEGLLEDADQVC